MNTATRFEGHNPAREAAQLQSKKEMCDVYVCKANLGGLVYFTVKTNENLPNGTRVLEHFKNGLKQK